MKTQTGITTIECAVMLASIDSTPSFCFSTDLDASLADTVQDTLTALLGVASREPSRFPGIQAGCPCTISVCLSGKHIGTDDLDRLLPLMEAAAQTVRSPVHQKIGAIDARATWQSADEVSLDTLPNDVAQDYGEESDSERVTDETKETDEPTKQILQLANRVLPRITDADIREFESVLRHAQQTRPRDTEQFRDTVNLLLDVLSLRIKTQDGHVGRLNIDRNQVLTLTRATGGNRGFKNSVISLVAVERTRVGNRFASCSKGPSR